MSQWPEGWHKPPHVSDEVYAEAVQFGLGMRGAAGWDPEETDVTEEVMADAYALGACDAWLVLKDYAPFG